MVVAAGPLTEYSQKASREKGLAAGGDETSSRARIAWFWAAAIPTSFAIFVAAISADFGYDRDVVDMPVLVFTSCFLAAGLAFAIVAPRLLAKSAESTAQDLSRLVPFMIAAGFIARAALFSSGPILEDDYQRYLWDGAVTAHGLNPYLIAPRSVIEGGSSHALAGLAADAGVVLRRINHPQLKTIYPPIAQAAFAAAYTISPWSLLAWRGVMLTCDALTLVLLLALLKDTGRTPLWAVLYWWNPLAIKEAINSAHMEPLVICLVMLTLWLAARRRPLLATTALALATGAKLWPILLLPIVLRATVTNARQLTCALVLFATLLAICAAPVIAAGINETSGFLAYAHDWKTNSALFPLLQSGMALILNAADISSVGAAAVVKIASALAVAGLAITVSVAPIQTARDLIVRSAIVVFVLVFLSPVQYPWYVMWGLPFLAFWPSPAVLTLGATIPLYYASFHFAARETLETAGPVLLALIWLPVWIIAGLELRRVTAKSRKSILGTAGAGL